MTWRRRLARVLALFRKSRLEHELDDEVIAHLELAERDARARGLTPAEARREALRSFGGVEQMKEVHRDHRSSMWLENLVKDARYGLASLRRDPVFALVAVGILAFGTGANTAMFSLVDGILLKPMPFPEPHRIVRVWEAPTPTSANSTTTRNFVEFKRLNRSFAALSAESASTATVIIDGMPARLTGRYVSADHFDVFGVQPLLGRGFRPEEDQPGAERVLIISHAAWQQNFGGDGAVLGRTVTLDELPYRIIGVLPPGAFDRHRARPQDDPAGFWRLNAFTERELAHSAHWLNPVGRLKPGVTLEQARDDMRNVRAQIDGLIPAWKKEWGVTVEPYDEQLIDSGLRLMVYLAFGAVVLVLLIACANIANLLLARGVARQKELAIRAALGASRWRIVAQLLTEGAVVAVAGGLAGVGLAALLLQAAVPLLPAWVPFTAEITLHWRVLLFSLGVALLLSMLIGLLPALRLSSASPGSELNASSRGVAGSHDRVRRAIVAAEVAVSLVLICGSILLFKSLLRLQQVDIGVRVDNIITMSLDLSRAQYRSPEYSTTFYPRVVERLEAVPGVESATVSGDIPLEGTGGENLRLPGREDRLLIRFKRADASYFATMGIPLVAGRGITDADRMHAPPIVIMNEELARQFREYFRVDGVLGAQVDLPQLGFGVDRRVSMTVAGIVGNERTNRDLRRPVEAVAYVPLMQSPRLQVKVAVRAAGDPTSLMPAIRAAIGELDPQLALANITSMQQVHERSLSGLKEPAWLIAAFAALSMLLAAVGLYGVVSHAVQQQRREIGIRMALGARANDVLALVARNIMVMIAAGLVLGLAGAAALTRVMASLLFEVSALDPAAFAIAAATMASVGLIAALIPASRATRVDPTTALRAE